MFLLLVSMPSCGRIDFDPRVDGGALDGTETRCDPTAAFGAPILVPGVSDPTLVEATSRLTDDELTMYLWTNRSGNPDLERATRAGEAAPFSSVAISELNVAAADFEPTISPDELVLIFRSNRGVSGVADLYLGQRSSRGVPFALVGELTSLDTATVEQQPYLGSDALYFSSNRTGDFEIYSAARLGQTSFGPPVRVDLPGFGASDEGDPVISRDGLTLFFGSNAPGGLGQADLYVTTRASAAATFTTPTALLLLSSSAAEGPSWISPDGCRLYLSSAKAGTPDIYVATRGM